MRSDKKPVFGAGYTAEEITGLFNEALIKDLTRSRENRQPVARYDNSLRKAFIEYADGRREYI